MGRITKPYSSAGRGTITTAGILVALLAAGPALAADPAIKVQVRGLRIVGEGYGGEQGLQPFSSAPGVSLALLVTTSDGGLIEVDNDASKVEQLVDDKGTNLLTEPKYSMAGFSHMADVSPDGKAIMTEISGGTPPAKGASSVRAVGAIAIRTAREKKSHKAENVAVKLDEKVAAGPITFAIKSIGRPDWGDKPLRISLEANQDLGSVAGVRFLDAAGKEIEADQAGSMRMAFGDSIQETRDFDLAQKVDQVTVEVTCWTDMKTVTVPFDVTVKPGLE